MAVLQLPSYYHEKLRQTNDEAIYSSGSLPRVEATAVNMLCAFQQEIALIPYHCREISIASKKLEWWQAELVNMQQGVPTHPLTQALLPAISLFALPYELFSAYVEGVTASLFQVDYANFAELLAHTHRTNSLINLLISYISKANTPPHLNFAKEVGTTLRLIEIIACLRADLVHGRVYLPQEDLAAINLPTEELFSLKMTPKLQIALKQLADRAHAIFNQALASLSKMERKLQLCNIIQAKLALSRLEAMRRDNFAVLTHNYALTTGYKRYLTWRIKLFTAATGQPA